ncbi:septation protein SpoVG [Candidatus Phytoplasma phoenicium]|uniref:Septation protein SpoVG n=1 Tax=Candidatus Phytoplasma phoenicium TaxID=198422 RepID=A0A2S8NUS8_9MOLU|nr:septation protein SpoVG [Candidatus Phytoplasma phoenicium]
MLDASEERKEIDLVDSKEYSPLQITDVRVKSSKKQSRLKGTASITFNNSFVIHNIKIIDGKNGMFVAMPSTKNLKGVYLDIVHPINSDTRQMIEKHIKDAFQQMLENLPLEEK